MAVVYFEVKPVEELAAPLPATCLCDSCPCPIMVAITTEFPDATGEKFLLHKFIKAAL